MATIPYQEPLTANSLAPASAFNLLHIPLDNTLMVFINGVYQTENTDYTRNGNYIYTNTLISAGYTVRATYSYYAETPIVLDDPSNESILPEGIRGSTTLTPYVTSYDVLLERIKYQLGWPAVRIELCDDQIYDFINQAIEWYSKYAGYTEEYLAFSSQIYERGLGIKLDKIFTQQACLLNADFVTNTQLRAMTAQYVDYDLNNYRKVVDVFSVDPTEFTGTDVLFTLDYQFAQQTYFSYMLGSFGWDLVTWHILKDWLNVREKMFATRPYFTFNPRTQYLKIFPEPNTASSVYIGILGCRVERPLRDNIRERWVGRWALASTMIALAHVRGKFAGTTLFGGGQVNYNDLMSQGLEMRKELEDELMNKYGEVEPPFFFIS